LSGHIIGCVRTGVIVMVLAMAVWGVAGCMSGGNGNPGKTDKAVPDGKTEPGLLPALGRVRATDSTRKHIRYGDLAATRALVEADQKRFQKLHVDSSGDLGVFSPSISDNLGFDPLSFREGVKAGIAGDWAAILWGDYDVDAVDKRFAAFGIERSTTDGATTWTIDADNRRPDSGPLIWIAGPKALNNVRTRPGSFAYAIRRDTLAWVTDPGDDTLARDPKIKALAGCLGDVVAGLISAEPTKVVETVAAGVRAPSATDVTEVICIAPGSRERAEEIRRHASEELSTGKPRLLDNPWSELLPAAEAELTGERSDVVRVVARLGAQPSPISIMQLMVPGGDAADLLGFR
jgi:hypothetical protein